jgi:HEAT repeat protein
MLNERQIQKHIQALEDGDSATTRQALQTLREYEAGEWAATPTETLQPLVKALKAQLLKGAKQPSVQKDVAAILGNLRGKSRSAVPQLIELLSKGIPDHVRETAAAALGKIGKDARTAAGPLVEVLASARPALSVQAIRALGDIGCADDEVRSALLDLWLSPVQSQGGKAQVAVALCKLHITTPNLLATMTAALVGNQEAALRKAAAEALAWCGKEESDVVPALLTASLGDTNEEVRRAAQAGLDRMRLTHEEAIRLCSEQLGSSSHAEAALRKSGPLAVPALIEALGKEETAIRVKAARTLGSLGEAASGAAPALTAALDDDDPDVRLAAAKALWNVTNNAERVVPVLVSLLQVKATADPDAGEERRRLLQTVVEALGRIGQPASAAAPALNGLAKDKNRHVREAALAALQKLVPTGENPAGLKR